MSKNNLDFDELEKKIVNDNNLEKTLKDLHEGLSNEIERNRKNLFYDVKNALADFTEKLEKSVSQETEKKVSRLMEKHFQEAMGQFQKSFEQILSPILNKTKENMDRLHTQGANTIRSWERGVEKYTDIWTKPFFVMCASVAFTAAFVCLGFFLLISSPLAFYLMNDVAKEAYESNLKVKKEK